MKNIMRQFFAVMALVFVTSWTAFSAPVLPVDVQDSSYADKVSILMQLGIMERTESGLFEGDSEVSRKEFAKMLSVITAKQSGNESAASIKSSEAVQKVVDLLGYGVLAKERGYEKVASQLGLSVKGDILTRKSAAILLYDALETKMFEAVSYGGSIKYSNRNSETLLGAYMGMQRIEGRIVANDLSAASPYTPAGDGSIIIDGVRYLCGSTDIGREIGRTVIAFVSDTGVFPETVYAYCYKYGTNNDVIINGADIVKSQTGIGEIYYETSSGSIKRRTFSEDALVIYNGEVLDSYSDKTFRISGGTIVISEQGRENDVVYISEYTTKIAEGANVYNNKVFFKFGEKSLEIDKDRCKLEVYADGERASLADISAFDAVDVFRSKSGDKITLEITKTRISGIFEAMDEDRIYIAGREYIAAEEIYNIEECQLGEKYTFVVNSENIVCAVDNTQEKTGEYGYLFRVSGNPEMPEDGILLRIFTVGSEFEGFYIADRIRIDGKKYDIDEFFTAGNPILEKNLTKRQMIMYEKNKEGKIETIYTAQDNTSLENTNAALRLDMKEKNRAVRMYRNTFGINYRFSGSTKVFILPTAGNEDDEDCYKCTTIGNWGEDQRFTDFEVYNTKRSREIGMFVTYEKIAEESFGETKQKSNVIVVEKNLRTLDDDGCPCYKLTYYEAGAQKTAYFNDDSVYNKYPDAWGKYPKTLTAADVRSGDIMQIVQNAKGRITEFHMLLRISDNDTEYNEILPSGYSYTADSVPLAYLYTAYGEITDIYGGTVTVDVNNTTDPDNAAYNRNFKTEGVTSFLLYEDGKVRRSSADEIMLGDKVFVRAYNYIPYNIIVIR